MCPGFPTRSNRVQPCTARFEPQPHPNHRDGDMLGSTRAQACRTDPPALAKATPHLPVTSFLPKQEKAAPRGRRPILRPPVPSATSGNQPPLRFFPVSWLWRRSVRRFELIAACDPPPEAYWRRTEHPTLPAVLP